MNPRSSSGVHRNRVAAFGSKALRYGMAGIGPIAVAGSQFLLSVQLLHSLGADAFGLFSFLLVTSQLSTGIWAALFAAPMPLLLSTSDPSQRLAHRRALMAANLAGVVIAVPAFASLALVLHAPLAVSLLFGAFAAANLLRWFGRAYAYVNGHQWRTMTSDIVFSVTLMIGIAIGVLRPADTLLAPYATLLLGAVVGLAPFGRQFLKQQFAELSARDLGGYGEVWRKHSSWSLTGVLTTEATGNAHAYIVTLLSGANAFAPLAASALMMRPVSVASNALTDFERPQMARLLAEGRTSDADRSVTFFRVILLLAWVGTVALALALMRFAPGVLFPPQYDPRQLLIGTCLWLGVALVRLVRTPESVLLQAAGQFRPLASASLISCGVSVIGVTALLFTAGPVWSILGVLAGEVVFAILTLRERKRWANPRL